MLKTLGSCYISTMYYYGVLRRRFLTSPMWLQERLMCVKVVFWARTWEKRVAVGSDNSLPPKWRVVTVQFTRRAWQIAWPPSSSIQLRRRFKDVKVEFLDRAWAIAWAPEARILLSQRLRVTNLLQLISLPTARAPRSAIRLWDKSSSVSEGWSNRCFISIRALSSSTLLRVNLKTCSRKIKSYFDKEIKKYISDWTSLL